MLNLTKHSQQRYLALAQDWLEERGLRLRDSESCSQLSFKLKTLLVVFRYRPILS